PSWMDYPGLGVSPDALVVTGNLFANCNMVGCAFRGTKIRVFDKAELYDGDATATFVDIDRNANQGGTVQPAHHFGTTPANTFYLLQRWNSTFLNVLVLTGVPGSPALSTQLLNTADQGVCFTPSSGSLGSAPQGGTTKDIDTLCQRMMSAVWQDGSLWGTNTGSDGADSRTIVQWFEVETNGFPSGTPSVRQHGVIDGGTGEFTYMPSISVDACNNVAMTYTQSSSSRFPEMRYTGRLFGDTLNSVQAPVIAKASAFFFDDFTGVPDRGPVERWGDYSATVIDPANQSFWIAGEYAKVAASGGGNNGRWGTWLTNFTFGCSPVDITVADGSVAFGIVALGATVDSTGDVQTITVVTGPADLLIKSTAFTDGGNTWTLGASNGVDEVLWEFWDGSTYVPFTTANTLFTLAGPVAATQDVHFRLTMPTSTASASEHGATVTIVAVAP
ncbi:MAG: hypothetical protein J4O04_07905, partial [Chloroflexi bacterium]|nr:hypothetical protein [Chloroflexota bacterium]